MADEKTKLEAEIAELRRLRELCMDGSQWALWIDSRIQWLKEKLNDSGRTA
jgi:hypothetical protein